MASMNGGNEVVAKSVRKTSLEVNTHKSNDGTANTLRRVRSDSLAPDIPTFTPKFLRDETNQPPKKKRSNLNLHDTALPEAGVSAKGQTKKPASGRRRKSSVHQGLVLEVAALHKLNMQQELDNRVSNCSSTQSMKTSMSLDFSLDNQRSDQSRLSPSLCITYSPDTEDHVSFGDGSDTSSVYHSSVMYPPDEGPKLLGHLLENPRKTRDLSKRRMSSPINHNIKCQELQVGSNTKAKMKAFTVEGRRHSTQDITDVLAFELPALPSKSNFHSTQEDLTTTSPSSAVSIQQRDSPDPSMREDTLTVRTKEYRGSMDSQMQKTETNKELADQNCNSYFGIMLSIICFVLFLWYLAMVSSKFIMSALSFEPLNKIPTSDLGSVREVIVYITAGGQAGTNA